jgi:hypothetical protein
VLSGLDASVKNKKGFLLAQAFLVDLGRVFDGSDESQ